jgi:hypothetical protein
MKKITKLTYLFFISLLFLLFIGSFKILKTDFRYAHQSSLVYQNPFSWTNYFISLQAKKLLILFFGNNTNGLQRVYISASEKSFKKLLEKTPKSTKKWIKGSLTVKGNTEKIDIRYVGDNPRNWLREKKAIRIKKKKFRSSGNTRIYEYHPLVVNELISAKIASQFDILVPKYKLVELFINDKSKGVFMEKEKLNKNFFYKNNIMPINLYKGENHGVEKFIGLDENIYNNPGLWRKISSSDVNMFQGDFDLRRFFETLNASELKNDKFKKFLSYINFEYWSKYSIYDTLTQNISHEYFHNSRIAIDPWNGYAFPIVIQPSINESFNKKIIIDSSTNDITALLNRSSEYNHIRYSYLYKAVSNSKLFDNTFSNIQNSLNDLNVSLKRDPEKKNENVFNEIKINKSFLESNRRKILGLLQSKPNANWQVNENNFSIFIDDLLPASNIEIFFSSQLPSWLFLDENHDGIYNTGEHKFYPNNKNSIKIPVNLYANRYKYTTSKTFMYFDNIIKSSNTKFSFISHDNIMPVKIIVENLFTKNKYTIESKQMDAVDANKLNKPIFANNFIKKENKYNNLSGEIIVNDNFVYNQPVKIKAGTVFFIKENKNLIFKNIVIAEGNPSNPIIFKKIRDDASNWGSIVLLGNKTSNSSFNNVIFTGGSGGNIEQYIFNSMFSIHNAENIKLKNVSFLDKSLFYKTYLNIVYCNKINIDNILFENKLLENPINILFSKNVKSFN